MPKSEDASHGSDIPVLIFDWKELPNVADNIWNAQMAGWERILTYRGPLHKLESRGIRKQTMTYEVDGKRYHVPATNTHSHARLRAPPAAE